MWRRVAGGLPTPLQNTLYSRMRPVLLPGKSKTSKPPANEYTEMWRAAASLERLDLKTKEQLGDAALKVCRRSPTSPHAFFALTRLGARVLLYGPLNGVLHPHVIEKWIDALLPFEPGHASERFAWAFCLTQLARKSGQRAIDIDDSHRLHVLNVLNKQTVPSHWVRMVEEVLELEERTNRARCSAKRYPLVCGCEGRSEGRKGEGASRNALSADLARIIQLIKEGRIDTLRRIASVKFLMAWMYCFSS